MMANRDKLVSEKCREMEFQRIPYFIFNPIRFNLVFIAGSIVQPCLNPAAELTLVRISFHPSSSAMIAGV